MTLKMAGISQEAPNAFRLAVDRAQRARGMIALHQRRFQDQSPLVLRLGRARASDKDFSRTYKIAGYQDYVKTSQLYLTGLNGRNYFDLRAYKFHVRRKMWRRELSGDPNVLVAQNPSRNHLQPTVLPSLDYTKTVDEPVAGGQLRFDVNLQGINRRHADITWADGVNDPPGIANNDVYRVRGLDGTSARLTAEAEWKKQIVTDGGLVVSPMLHARGDAIGVDRDPLGNAAIANMAGTLPGLPYTNDGSLAYGAVGTAPGSSYFRPMVTAGLELRWPILFGGDSRPTYSSQWPGLRTAGQTLC